MTKVQFTAVGQQPASTFFYWYPLGIGSWNWVTDTNSFSHTYNEVGEHTPALRLVYSRKDCADTLYLEPGIKIYSGNNDLSAFNLRIFPNPAKEIVFIHLPQSFESKQINYQVYNLTGKIVLSGKYRSSQGINTNYLPNGIYLLDIYTKKDENYSERFIISR